MARRNPRVRTKTEPIVTYVGSMGHAIPVPLYLPGKWKFAGEDEGNLGDPVLMYYRETKYGTDEFTIIIYPKAGKPPHFWDMSKGLAALGEINDDDTDEAEAVARAFLRFVKKHDPSIPLHRTERRK